MWEFGMSTSQAGYDVTNNQRTPGRSGSGGALLFARNFFRHPRMLGSIIPSSRFLIKQLLEPIDWEQARVIVEYGPGVGGITAEVLRRMRPDAMLIAIETNPDFVKYLRSSIQDERLHVVEASAEAVDEILRQYGQSNASYVISGIPFSTIPAPVRERILRKTCEVLKPGGSFLVFQFSTRVLEDLQRIFRYVRRQFEPWNVLPAHLFFCQPDTA
jgi:phospholipid N-methyltransferase